MNGLEIEINHLEEPLLEFAEGFTDPDAKTGLAEFGPYGKSEGLHVHEIRLGFVGTSEAVTNAQGWIERCSSQIQSKKGKRSKTKQAQEVPIDDLFAEQGFSESVRERREGSTRQTMISRDFVGFNHESPFKSQFRIQKRWGRRINYRKIEDALSIDDEGKRIETVCQLFEDQIERLCETDPTPHVIILALTDDIFELASSTQLDDGFYLNLRRLLKARAMGLRFPRPTQIILPHTIEGGQGVQDEATRAWNFCTALYYKAGGVPWRTLGIREDTCFIGVSFYVADELPDAQTIRSSVAMAFDHLGQGLVLRGESFVWDNETEGTPHLTTKGARNLVRQVLQAYDNTERRPPRRVVIHKTSGYWQRDGYKEIEGFYKGIDDVYSSCEIDLIAVRPSDTLLFREGDYPVLRGTHFNIEDEHFVFTRGYIENLETYPGPRLPKPLHIAEHYGGTSKKELARELLALSKMNVNNCSFADKEPITLSFSGKVGEVMKHAGSDPAAIQSLYRFYM